MIASFFQSLNSSSTEYLLISGQATVLYGAATFSEDIDLWVNPTAINAERFLTCLRLCKARYYKLTPNWKLDFLLRGHGFHFLLPDPGREEVYLDVMGTPPRVNSFGDAAEAAQWLETDWGNVRVIGIRELIQLKKTQRLEDYPVIGRLALRWLADLRPAPKEEDYRWAFEHIFTLPELQTLLEQHPLAAQFLTDVAPRQVQHYVREFPTTSNETLEKGVADWLQSRIADLQAADRLHWRGIIRELKQLREGRELMPEGATV